MYLSALQFPGPEREVQARLHCSPPMGEQPGVTTHRRQLRGDPAQEQSDRSGDNSGPVPIATRCRGLERRRAELGHAVARYSGTGVQNQNVSGGLYVFLLALAT